MESQQASNSVIREARESDLPAIAEIYNYYVANSTCTFATEPEGPAYWQAWLTSHDKQHPAIVMEQDGRVVGWGSLTPWNKRCAYRFSIEDSVYVQTGLHRRGIGNALLGELIRLARELEFRNIVAQISNDQLASERLHAQHGFCLAGRLESIGYKFDRWIDVGIWQLKL